MVNSAEMVRLRCAVPDMIQRMLIIDGRILAVEYDDDDEGRQKERKERSDCAVLMNSRRMRE